MRAIALALAGVVVLSGCGSADTQLAACRVEAAKLPPGRDQFGFVTDCMKVAGYVPDWIELNKRLESNIKGPWQAYTPDIAQDPSMWQRWYIQEIKGWFARKPSG